MNIEFRIGLFPGSDGNVYAGRLPAQVSYTLECSQCSVFRLDRYVVNPGGCLIWPDIPDGWQWVGDRLICPKHRVRVEDAPPEAVKYSPPCRRCKGHAVADPDSGLCESCFRNREFRREIWTCPHCHNYRWEGPKPPRECPSCRCRCCCPWLKEEITNAKP